MISIVKGKTEISLNHHEHSNYSFRSVFAFISEGAEVKE
jgi:hypothetical protein